MHGYQANRELDAGKSVIGGNLASAGFTIPRKIDGGGHGSRSGVAKPRSGRASRFRNHRKGQAGLGGFAAAYELDHGRDVPFSDLDRALLASAPWHFETQMTRRQRILAIGAATRRSHVKIDYDETGHAHHEAVWMVKLMIEHVQDGAKSGSHGWRKSTRSRAPAKRPRTPKHRKPPANSGQRATKPSQIEIA